MGKLDVESVDLGDELRQGVQFCLGLAPIVVGSPIANERLEPVQLYALGLVGDGLPVGPTCRRDALAQVLESLLRNGDAEGADFGGIGGDGRPRGQQRQGEAVVAATEPARNLRRVGRGDALSMIVLLGGDTALAVN